MPQLNCLLTQEYAVFRGIRFARSMDAPDGEILWLDEGPILVSLFESRDDLDGLAFFASGDAPGLTELAEKRGVLLTISEMALLECYDHLSRRLDRHHSWERKLLDAAAEPEPMRRVTESAAELAGGTLFLINDSCQMISFGGNAGLTNHIAREILDRGGLSLYKVEELLQNSERIACRSCGEGWNLYVWHECGRLDFFPGMLLFVPETFEQEDAHILLELVRRSIDRRRSADDAGRWKSESFQLLLPELLSGKLSDDDEIARRLSMLSCAPQQFCAFIIVELAKPKIFANAKNALLSNLKAFFPDANAAIYNENIVVMLSGPNREMQPRPAFDDQKLTQLLEHYDAYAAFSNATSRRDMLRTNYLLASSTLQLAKALHENPKERIFFFEEYAEYISIDLCINSFINLMGHDDLIYLTHPDVTKVYRHDLAEHDTLLEVLYLYCINNGNISAAAQAAFMHRNTFSAKLAELRRLINLDLSSGEIRQRVIFSYKILRYYDRFVKINLGQRFSVSPPFEQRTEPDDKSAALDSENR